MQQPNQANLDLVQQVIGTYYAEFPYYDDIEEVHYDERQFIRTGHISVFYLFEELCRIHEMICGIAKLLNPEERRVFIESNYDEIVSHASTENMNEALHEYESLILEFLFGLREEQGSDEESVRINSLLEYDLESMRAHFDALWSEEKQSKQDSKIANVADFGLWGTTQTKSLVWEGLASFCTPLQNIRSLISIVIPQALSSEISEIKGRLRHRAKKYHESIAAWRVDPKSSMGSKPDYFDSSTWEKPFVCDHIWKNINIEDIRGKYFKHYEEDSEDPRSWGAWRFYSPCRITGDTIEIDGKVISKILQSTGFESVDDFNSHVGSYPNNCLPDSLQQRLLTIFKKPTCTENDLPNRFTINLPDQGYDSKASGTTKTVIIESPFCLAKDPAGIEISIGSMQIEQHDGGKFAVVIRAGVTCASLFESRNDELGEACRVLIDGLAMGEPCEIGDEDRDVLQAFLEAQGIDQCLAYNPDFLDELGMAVRFMAESIGISTIAFVDAEGNTEELYLDGDEEIGFTSLF